ncbi:MAG: AmmeMemoRadiSam system protein B [Planctomycetes bacterium]|jgi:hypothetical protein|nr:AmmeMemoRadiSam system protein B [Planctomycetota bacterium]MDP6423213.1 AmmeMemoRadiSam system protein B [Planctomycetota bacterium]
MKRRPAHRAGTFYPSSAGEIAAQLASFASQPLCGDRCFGALVPHAGWGYSGRLAHAAFARLASARPERVVLLGAVHVPGVVRPAIGEWDQWEVPTGLLTIDREFEQSLLDAGAVERNRHAHVGEHSIEVQLPIVVSLLGDVPVVPIAVPSRSSAIEVGEILASLAGATTVVVASSDLTHYGEANYGFAPAGVGAAAVEWARRNDERFLDCVRALDASGALKDAREHRSACGAGAVAAAITFAARRGARRAEVLEHTTSLAVEGASRRGSFVGYAAAVFT